MLNRKILLLAAGVALLGATACGGGSEAAVTTTVATEETVADTLPGPRVATERPEVAPEQVEASGACAEAFDAVRAVHAQYPSGLAAQQVPEANATVNAAVASAAKECPTETFQAFMATEHKPWLLYALPDDYVLPGS